MHKLVSTCRPCLAAVPGTQKELWQIVIPRELQATVVHLAHEGHLGQGDLLVPRDG